MDLRRAAVSRAVRLAVEAISLGGGNSDALPVRQKGHFGERRLVSAWARFETDFCLRVWL